MLITAADYRGSLRAYEPRVFVNGQRVESVADEPLLAPGISAVGVTYDLAHRAKDVAITTARQVTSGKTVSRMLHVNENSTDLLYKLEAVRLVCKVSGCAKGDRGALHRGSHRLQLGRLVFGHFSARRRLARSHLLNRSNLADG
jgi:aromatic ring hydroxylase